MQMDNKIWDAIIIGAGPAGALSAALLADQGWRILLLERSPWPREKVCGGCVNAAAIEMLRDLGMSHLLQNANPLHQFSVHVAQKKLTLNLPAGVAIPREELDARLVTEATHRGAQFLPAASALLLPHSSGNTRQLKITIAGESSLLDARIVLACDGIAGTSLDLEPWAAWRIASDAWFGASTTLESGPLANALSRHATIGMHVDKTGYVGTARYADGRVHIAAALNPAACKNLGGPNAAVANILAPLGNEFAHIIPSARFRGTGLLTRRRAAVGGYRVLAVGDACGYIEPFTGEGIAWAIRAAREVAAFLLESKDPRHHWHSDLPALWENRLQQTLRPQQRACKCLRQLIRHPRLAHSTVSLIQSLPALRTLAETFARSIGTHSFDARQFPQGVFHDPC